MFSQTVEHALRAMVYLASVYGEAANNDLIAREASVPAGYLSKIMRDLVVAGLVLSARGPHGGFRLAREPAEITILDVVNAVQPLQRIRACPLGDPDHKELCPLHRRLDEALAGVERTCGGTSLAELLRKEPDPHRCNGGNGCGAKAAQRRRAGE